MTRTQHRKQKITATKQPERTARKSTHLVLVLLHVDRLLLPVLREHLAHGVHLGGLGRVGEGRERVVERGLLELLVRGYLKQQSQQQ